jgi:hypothetical protein
MCTEQFTAEEARLLDAAFGSDWSGLAGSSDSSSSSRTGSGQAFDVAALMRLASLEAEDVGRLGGVMNKLQALSK